MKRRDITARWASRLPLAAIILLLGLQACSDTLPPTGPGITQSTRETLVYYNDIDQLFIDSTSTPWESWIMSVRPDGTGREQVINGFISAAPRNGFMVFYSGPPLGQVGIYRAKDNGQEPQLIVREGDNEFILPQSIALASDGASIAYISQDYARGALTLYVRRGNSIFSTDLASSISDDATICPPAFSPDGRRVGALAWAGDLFSQALVVLNAVDGSVETYPVGLSGVSLYSMLSAPFDWSPDGRKIAFVGSSEEGSDLMTLDVQTRQVDTLTRDSLIEDTPRYLGTTNQILYTAMDPVSFSGSNVYLRDITGARRQLTFDAEGFKLGLNVSPDGRYASYADALAPIGGILGAVRIFDIAKQTAGRPIASSIFGLFRQ